MGNRQLKNPIKKFNEHLTIEQQKAKSVIHNNTLTVLNGQAGTGKTHLAVCYALEQIRLHKLKQSEFEKIVITRATVMLKDHNNGFIPGGVEEKFQPWLQPIYDNMFEFMDRGKEELDEMIKNGKIEIVPLAYIQGRTFKDSIIIVDEVQNTTDREIEMLFSRIGKHSKMILCGDLRQQIITGRSGLEALLKICELSDKASHFSLTENFRDPIVKELLDLYEKIVWNERGKESSKDKKGNSTNIRAFPAA
jgi:phosphate starvation-inducible PhoH-like protein